ncbi:MAG: hypothetical protein EVA89_34315 [Sandaracinaceae bacterium]|nr:MAG: hypothetical protein EVA89_34315 [Sandaracinaceae bacterium]
MAESDNPFERYDLDPMQGPKAITERLRELAEAAPDEETRKQVRAAWEALTMHPQDRLRAALQAHPDSHGLASAPPPPPAITRPDQHAIELTDLVLRPSLVATLGLEARALAPLPDVPPEDDPMLR